MQEEAITRDGAACFDELYQAYANDVLRMSYFYLADRQKAEDVCQDVFVRLFTTHPQLEIGKEKAWLLKVAMNRCRDHWRGVWMKRVMLGSPGLELIPAKDEMEGLVEKQAVMGAINRLPAIFKEVILLHYYEGLGIAEMADMLSISTGTVASRLSRARTKLETIMKEEQLHV